MSCRSCSCSGCRQKRAPKFIKNRTYEVVRAHLGSPPAGTRFVAKEIEWTGEAYRCVIVPWSVVAFAGWCKLVRATRQKDGGGR